MQQQVQQESVIKMSMKVNILKLLLQFNRNSCP